MNDRRRISVVYFQRKPLPIHKSIESIFNDVRERMPSYIKCRTKVFRFYSNGLFKRLYILWEGFRNQGDINHITGDIHFSAILMDRIKTMMTIHDCRMLSDTYGIKHFIFKLFWFTLPLKKCALVTVVSHATKKQLLKFVEYPQDKIHVIPVAISRTFTFYEKPFNNVKPVILQVGTTINKNIDRLIEAIQGVSCHLHIIGHLSASQLEKLQVSNIDYSNSYDLSEVELSEKYKKSDLLSFVSTYEGFGMPIVEANAVGRPVITSNILSMPEVAGNAACLVDPYSVAEIRAGILKIINDEPYRKQLIANGLENCKRFNPQAIADQYLALYLKLSESRKINMKHHYEETAHFR